MSLYQLVVYLEGEEADEALEAFWHGGAPEALDVLTDFDEGTVISDGVFSSASLDDMTQRIGDYHVIINPERKVAALEVVS